MAHRTTRRTPAMRSCIPGAPVPTPHGQPARRPTRGCHISQIDIAVRHVRALLERKPLYGGTLVSAPMKDQGRRRLPLAVFQPVYACVEVVVGALARAAEAAVLEGGSPSVLPPRLQHKLFERLAGPQHTHTHQSATTSSTKMY